MLIYPLAVLFISLWRPASWGQLLRTPALWVLVLASGTTNATFNWGVTIGDVVRVVLLFYLMPLWAVLLARLLLGERADAAGRRCAWRWRWPARPSCSGRRAARCPLPRTLAEWLGVLGGFTFALNNVMLRREAHQPEVARALAMFLGGAVVAGVLALALGTQGLVPRAARAGLAWVAGALALALCSWLATWRCSTAPRACRPTPRRWSWSPRCCSPASRRCCWAPAS